jgi:hypothetical protein
MPKGLRMATLLTMLCVRGNKQELVPGAIVIGFALDFIAVYLFLKK